MDRIEDLIVDVVDRILKSPIAHLLYELNPVSDRWFFFGGVWGGAAKEEPGSDGTLADGD